MLKRFLKYYKPHMKMFILDLCAAFFISVCDLIYPIITRNMLNNYIPNKEMRLLVTSAIVLMIIYVVKLLLNYFVTYWGHMVGVHMQAEIRREVFNHLQKL